MKNRRRNDILLNATKKKTKRKCEIRKRKIIRNRKDGEERRNE